MSNISRKILLTGASGFVGSALRERLNTHGFNTLSVVRNGVNTGEGFFVIDTLETADLSSALAGVDVVVHCAGRAHVMKDTQSDPLEAFRKVNVEGTLNLARQAARAGVSRFIFISSVKVNGEWTSSGNAFLADDPPAPQDAYGVSKMEAERELRALSVETGMETVIIRPVLVYGPQVKGNFRNMLSWLDKGIPLPFGAVRNKRSLVFIGNLVDFITTCITHPAAANQTFLVSDGDDISTRDLLARLARLMNRPSRLIPIPVSLLKFLAVVMGQGAIAQRLLGSLQVDISKNRNLLGWSPPVSVEDGLRRSALDTRSNP